MGIQETQVTGFEKSYYSTFRKAQRRGNPIADQTDLLTLQIVTKTEADFTKAKDLDLMLGTRGPTPFGWRKLSSTWNDEGYDHAITTIRSETSKKNPVVIEVQLFSKEAYMDYLTQRHEGDYSEPRYRNTLRRAADDYADRLLGPVHAPYVLRFDRDDPELQMTGDLQADMAENLSRLADADPDVYPLYPSNKFGIPYTEKEMTPALLNEAYWPTERFPEGAVAFDWSSSSALRGSPNQFVSAKLVSLVPVSSRDEERATLVEKSLQQKPLHATAPLPTLSIVLPGPISKITNDKDRKAILNTAQSPRTKLVTSDDINASKKARDRNQRTRSERAHAFLEKAFGRGSDWPFFAYAMGLASVDELVQALGNDILQVGQLTETFLRHFVRLTVEAKQENKTVQVLLQADQARADLLVDVIKQLSSSGWIFSYDINLQTDVKTKTVRSTLTLLKAPVPFDDLRQINSLLEQTVRSIHIPRTYSLWQPSKKVRKVRSVLPVRSDAVWGSIQRLSMGLDQQAVGVQSVRFVRMVDGGAEYEWCLAGPDDKVPSSSEVALPSVIQKILTWKNIPPKSLVGFEFSVLPVKDWASLSRVVFTNDEIQIGILADVAKVINQQGWNITGRLLQRYHGDGRRTEIDIERTDHAKPTAEDRERLEKALQSVWRVRGERPPVNDGQWLTLYFGVNDSAGVLGEVAEILSQMGISIDSGNLSETSKLMDDGAGGQVASPSYLEFVLYAPKSLSPEMLQKSLETRAAAAGIELSASVSRSKVSRATAKVISDMTRSDFDDKDHRIPGTAPRHFIPLPDHLSPSSSTDPRDAVVDEKFVGQFVQARNLMFRYCGFSPDGKPSTTAAAQMRKYKNASGVRDTPYPIHPMEVLNRYMSRYQGMDETFIVVALLHDLLEDGPKNVLKFYQESFEHASDSEREGIRQSLLNRFGRFGLTLEGPLSILPEDDILKCARLEIMSEIEVIFPTSHRRLIYFLKLFDHSGSDFRTSIANLSDQELADVLAVKAADQSVNLDTALEAKNLPKTLMKNIRWLFPTMYRENTRQTVTYWESRVDLMRTLIKEFGRLDPERALEALFNDVRDYNKKTDIRESWKTATPETLAGISDVLVWIRDHRQRLLSDSTPAIALERFEKGLRTLAQKIGEQTSDAFSQDIVRPSPTVSAGAPEFHMPSPRWTEFTRLRQYPFGWTTKDRIAFINRGQIEINSDAISFLGQIANPYRARLGLAALSDLTIDSYVYEHERQHLIFSRSTQEQKQHLQEVLRDPALYEGQSVRNFDELKARFTLVYGKTFADEALAIEEMWVLAQSPDLFGDGPISLDKSSEDRIPMPSRVLDALRDFSFTEPTSTFPPVNESTLHVMENFILSESQRLPASTEKKHVDFDTTQPLSKVEVSTVDEATVNVFKHTWRLVLLQDPQNTAAVMILSNRLWTALAVNHEREVETLLLLTLEDVFTPVVEPTVQPILHRLEEPPQPRLEKAEPPLPTKAFKDDLVFPVRTLEVLRHLTSTQNQQNIDPGLLSDEDTRTVAFKSFWNLSQTHNDSPAAVYSSRLSQSILLQTGLQASVILLAPVYSLLKNPKTFGERTLRLRKLLHEAGMPNKEIDRLFKGWFAIVREMASGSIQPSKLTSSAAAFALTVLATDLEMWNADTSAKAFTSALPNALTLGLSLLTEEKGMQTSFYIESRALFLKQLNETLHHPKARHRLSVHLGFFSKNLVQRTDDLSRFRDFLSRLDVWGYRMRNALSDRQVNLDSLSRDLWVWFNHSTMHNTLALDRAKPINNEFWDDVYQSARTHHMAVVLWVPVGQESPEAEAQYYLRNRVQLQVTNQTHPVLKPESAGALSKVVLIPVSREMLQDISDAQSLEGFGVFRWIAQEPPLVSSTDHLTLIPTKKNRPGLTSLEIAVLNLFRQERPLSFIFNWTAELKSIRGLRDIEHLGHVLSFVADYGVLKFDEERNTISIRRFESQGRAAA